MTLALPLVALVDDDKVFQLIASRSIKATNFKGTILQFNNGGEAIEYLEAHAHEELLLPDVLFLDINMPVVDGWTFLEDYIDLKPRIQKPIRIYMVSSSLDPKDIERAKSFEEIREYISKPISQEKFAQLVTLD
ncbi:MAG TPA: response regulator [Cyclobacteriaceae bacterium]|jgi:CheY-like chemotaxis protein